VVTMAATLAACAPAPPPAVPPPPPLPPAAFVPPPAPAPASSPEPAEPSPPPARWGLAYHRACNGSITPPVLGLEGRTVASCGAVFDVDKGRFREAAPLGLIAFLPSDRALVDEYRDGGLTVAGREERDRVRDAGGRPSLVALSADGARVVSFEETDKGERLLIVRDLPSLKRVRATSLGKGPAARAVGFLADGREAVLAGHPCVMEACGPGSDRSCRRPRCGDTALFAVD